MLDWADDTQSRRMRAMLAAAREAYRIFPDRPATAAALKAMLEVQGRWTEAAGIGGPPSAAASHDRSGEVLEEAAAQARRDGSWQRVLTLCADPASLAPPASIRFHRALASARLGRAEATIDPCRDAVCVPIEPRSAWHSVADLNRDLLVELAQSPALDIGHHRLATRDGRQSELLDAEPASALGELFRCVRAAVDTMLQERPWLLPPAGPGAWTLNGWSVTYPEQGRQVSHFHPDGWFSAVYCVARPEGSRARLELGSLAGSADEDLCQPWPLLALDPAPGDCAIFPSWIPHAATPTGCGGERVVVAIDVVMADMP